MSLSERLAGPFNVEMTIEPISIKISDAIMNFQESAFQVNNCPVSFDVANIRMLFTPTLDHNKAFYCIVMDFNILSWLFDINLTRNNFQVFESLKVHAHTCLSLVEI